MTKTSNLFQIVKRDLFNPDTYRLVDQHNHLMRPRSRKQALRDSIVKWQTLLDFVKSNPSEQMSVHDNGSETCALCHKYIRWNNSLEACCPGCPVAEKTGLSLCHGTPYRVAHDMLKARGVLNADKVRAVRKELNFLTRLYDTLYGKPTQKTEKSKT